MPVDTLPVDARSANYVTTIGSSHYLNYYFGFPYNVVDSTQAKQKFSSFSSASYGDNVAYPVPSNPLIETLCSDRHLIIIDRDSHLLYETYDTHQGSNGLWSAGMGAVWNLSGYSFRKNNVTPVWSADAAGLPVFPGLLRYDEVSSGEIKHALRFTVPSMRGDYVWPARASSPWGLITDRNYPPAGQRFRLKASFDISGYPPQAKVILTALKKYGMIVADNNGQWSLSGVPDSRWNTNDIYSVYNSVQGSDFEAVDESSLMIDKNSAQAKTPTPKPSPTPTPTSTPAPSPVQNGSRIGAFNSMWYFDNNSNGKWDGPAIDKTFHFGTTGDIPVVGDWNNDGTTDAGVFRPSNGHWYLDTTKTGAVSKTFHFGTSGDIPVVGDWNNDGTTDAGVFRPSNGYWYLDTTKTGAVSKTFRFGKSGDIPVIGDWNGDGTSDTGIFRPSSGYWYLDTTKTGAVSKTFHFGKAGDIPIIEDLI